MLDYRRIVKEMDYGIYPATDITPDINYKYNEDIVLNELQEYVDATYDQHYVQDDGLQALDVFIALGNAETTFRDNSIKYLMRYGKKDGRNRKDLLKVLHYVILMLGQLENK
jgi:hypothetical protein